VVKNLPVITNITTIGNVLTGSRYCLLQRTPVNTVLISSSIFIIALILIFSEKVNRTIVALSGAVVMVAVGDALGFYTRNQVIESVDFNTLGLLLGMMILVALLEPTGFFQYIAVYVGKLSKGNPTVLLILLGIVTTIISMFLDNVTSVVLMAPVTILICEIIGVSAVPFLMAEALLSDTGGVATMVGDPPNILIASAAGFSFNDFLAKSLPIVLIILVIVIILLLRLFKSELKPNGNIDLEALEHLNPSEALKDKRSSIKVIIVIGIAILGFLLEEHIHMAPSFIALAAASIGLLWVHPDVKETLKLISWDILLFFACLFVMVGAMEASGVLQLLADYIVTGVNLPPVVFGVLILWLVATLSALVDNVPMTIALIPVIQSLGQSGVDVNPLWWALVFGAGFGGNGTIIGSTANIVVASLSEKTRTPITPRLWSKVGLPVMLIACAVASVLYVAVYYLIGF